MKELPLDTPCRCGSKKIYRCCCYPYHSGTQIPPSAESLMRSRYVAYTFANMDYIAATMREKAAEGFDRLEALQWAFSVKWQRLKVLDAFADKNDDNIAYVEFFAHYIMHGTLQKLQETSRFKKINQQWFYVDGELKKSQGKRK